MTADRLKVQIDILMPFQKEIPNEIKLQIPQQG